MHGIKEIITNIQMQMSCECVKKRLFSSFNVRNLLGHIGENNKY